MSVGGVDMVGFGGAGGGRKKKMTGPPGSAGYKAVAHKTQGWFPSSLHPLPSSGSGFFTDFVFVHSHDGGIVVGSIAGRRHYLN